MKYAFMSFSCPEASFAEMLDLAVKSGYDGVELRAQSKHGHGAELDADATVRSDIRKQAREAGIDICCVATSCRFADPDTAAGSVEDMLQAIDLAADIGAPCIRVFGGKLGEGLSRAAATDLLAESLRSGAEKASSRGVTVCMETHDEWTNPQHVAAVIKAVDHPNIAVNWDIMHPVLFSGWDMAAAFEALRPWIRHVHFHDGPISDSSKLKPIGTGDIDHHTAVRLLKALPYEGFLSGEWINWEDDPAEIYLPRELATMKTYENDAG